MGEWSREERRIERKIEELKPKSEPEPKSEWKLEPKISTSSSKILKFPPALLNNFYQAPALASALANNSFQVLAQAPLENGRLRSSAVPVKK